jgi:hypothetical protein
MEVYNFDYHSIVYNLYLVINIDLFRFHQGSPQKNVIIAKLAGIARKLREDRRGYGEVQSRPRERWRGYRDMNIYRYIVYKYRERELKI